MGWENRSGRFYYYRKRRQGSRVVSEYLGASKFAELLSEMDEMERDAGRERKRAERQEMARWLALDREVNQTLDLCSSLASAALLAAGYRTHKGQWRRKRGNRRANG
jgi:hypothetical protein